MSAHAAPPAGGLTLSVRGTSYPVVLPKLSDPRLHLAAVITTLQVLGQAAFHFRVSIAQILLSVATCALLEIAITFRKQRALIWPASAMLTGNGVAFILRVPGTRRMNATPLPVSIALAGHIRTCCLRNVIATSRTAHVSSEIRICAIETRKVKAVCPSTCSVVITAARCSRGSLSVGSSTG